MSFKLLLPVLVSLAACAQPFQDSPEEELSSIEAAACSAEPSKEEVERAAALWAKMQRPAMEAAGLDSRGQQVMSRRFGLMALEGPGVEVKCCDDHIGCFPVDVDEEACLAHLALLGCAEGYEPTCDENECYCSATC